MESGNEGVGMMQCSRNVLHCGRVLTCERFKVGLSVVVFFIFCGILYRINRSIVLFLTM